ncbi:hypothetical protein Tco_0072374 [Tanacetum coccineum]
MWGGWGVWVEEWDMVMCGREGRGGGVGRVVCGGGGGSRCGFGGGGGAGGWASGGGGDVGVGLWCGDGGWTASDVVKCECDEWCGEWGAGVAVGMRYGKGGGGEGGAVDARWVVNPRGRGRWDGGMNGAKGG